MQLQDALRDVPNFLRNAQDAAQRAPSNPDTLYLWDNQVTAIEAFLAQTEDLNGDDAELAKARADLRELKKQIQTKVLEFELKQEGAELPPEPSEEELVADLREFGKDVEKLCKELAKAKLGTVKDVEEVEEPRQQIYAFLADTEPLVGKDAGLDQIRATAKETRAKLEAQIDEVVRAWRQQDLAGGDDAED